MQAESAASILKKISSAMKPPHELQWIVEIVSRSGIYINTPSKRLASKSHFRLPLDDSLYARVRPAPPAGPLGAHFSIPANAVETDVAEQTDERD